MDFRLVLILGLVIGIGAFVSVLAAKALAAGEGFDDAFWSAVLISVVALVALLAGGTA